jgi:hypothetical protein
MPVKPVTIAAIVLKTGALAAFASNGLPVKSKTAYK